MNKPKVPTMSSKRTLLAFLCLSVIPACGINVIMHDEGKAAKAAVTFAQTTFMSKDYAKAHASMSKRARTAIPLTTLTEAIAKMHPRSFPAQVAATEFEPIPGQRAMNILLKGSNEKDGETFYYRFLMEGDSGAGYKVSGLWRGNGPYPSPRKQPLPPLPAFSAHQERASNAENK